MQGIVGAPTESRVPSAASSLDQTILADPALAEVVFPLPLRQGFDYRVPASLDGAVQPGHRVWAPFGKRGRRMGIVVRRHGPEPGGLSVSSLKSVESLVEPEPVLSAPDLALARWMADRTYCSLGEAAFTVAAVGRKPPPKRPPPEPPLRAAERPAAFSPTGPQRDALEKIFQAVRAGGFHPFLLQGVAAAGKTEVYRRAIAETLARGRGAILLVPEIGLTPQMEDLFHGWFGDALSLWHSGISDGERWRVWRRAKEGRCRVVVGARSALFVPVTPLGLVIIDEEHDTSYKQDSSPHYHARDTAREKARLHGAALILGSATPSLESFLQAKEGTLEPLSMPRRADDRPFPALHLVDQRKAGWYLSDELVDALRDRLARGEQSLLFLNRRGYATRILCRACGWEGRCPRCAVNLVLHKEPGDVLRPLAGLATLGAAEPLLRCHTCDHREPPPNRCPQCRGEMIKTTGRGTQKILRDIATLFPTARLLRWDRDAMSRKNAHADAFNAVRAGTVDIIIGTQMVAQGHDFPRLTLVGVVNADGALCFPDFRAAERTFQRVTQVAGRAGRADRPGDVYVQTRHPGHYALRAVLARDYGAFAEAELAFRREAGYPPYTRLARAVLRASSEERAERGADDLVRHLQSPPLPAGAVVMGPAPAFHRQREGWAQWQVVVKAPPDIFPQALERLSTFAPPGGSVVAVDVDPEELG